jgi:hypothetical protein
MTNLESGLLGNGVPYIRGGSGPREAVVFFGVNALFKPVVGNAHAAGREERRGSLRDYQVSNRFSRLTPAMR